MTEHVEPGKWGLNPAATLRELARMDGDDPGYDKTICGIHRMLWALLNVDLNGYIPQGKLDEVNHLLEAAFRMGKRMDYRLHQYYHATGGGVIGDMVLSTTTVEGSSIREEMHGPVKFPKEGKMHAELAQEQRKIKTEEKVKTRAEVNTKAHRESRKVRAEKRRGE